MLVGDSAWMPKPIDAGGIDQLLLQEQFLEIMLHKQLKPMMYQKQGYGSII